MKLAVLILSFLIFLGIDFIYLTLTKKFMTDQIISVQKFAVNMKALPAALCYLVLFFGLYYFILKSHRPPLDAFILGLVIYGVFEFTNYSIFKNWKPTTVAIDTTWGAVLCWLTTTATYLVEKSI